MRISSLIITSEGTAWRKRRWIYPSLIANKTLIEGESNYSPGDVRKNITEIYKLIDKSDLNEKDNTKESTLKQTSMEITPRKTYSRNYKSVFSEDLGMKSATMERFSSLPFMMSNNQNLKDSEILEILTEGLHHAHPEIFEIPVTESFAELDDISECLKNKYEKGKKVNIDYILDLIENLQDMDEEQEWDIFYKGDSHWTCWLAKDGFGLDPDLPLIHSEFNIPKTASFEKISEAIVEGKYRQIWDKEVNKIIENPITEGFGLSHTQYKGYKLLGSMDSVEKQMSFTTESEDGNRILVAYSSCIPPEVIPKFEGFQRLKVVFSIMIIEEKQNGETCVQNYWQFDAGPRIRRRYWSKQVSVSHFVI